MLSTGHAHINTSCVCEVRRGLTRIEVAMLAVETATVVHEVALSRVADVAPKLLQIDAFSFSRRTTSKSCIEIGSDILLVLLPTQIFS